MAQIFADRVQETTTTSGQGTYLLLGASTGYQSFGKIGDANTVYYAASNGSSWEVGNGKYVLANTSLIRQTIIASSNADNAINWTTDTKTIFCDVPASLLANTGSGPWVSALDGATRFQNTTDKTKQSLGIINLSGLTINFHPILSRCLTNAEANTHPIFPDSIQSICCCIILSLSITVTFFSPIQKGIRREGKGVS